VTIAMVGLDQDLMQKNLSKQLAKPKRTCLLSPEYLSINIFFKCRCTFYIYAAKNGIEVPTDLVTGNQEPIYFS
jgi:hypothetical protein